MKSKNRVKLVFLKTRAARLLAKTLRANQIVMKSFTKAFVQS